MAEYIPSPRDWVREQVALYESSGGTKGTTLRDTGLPVIIVTNTGNKTGGIRKTPLMRVKDGNNYVLVGSQGGAPTNPVWVNNLRAQPAVAQDVERGRLARQQHGVAEVVVEHGRPDAQVLRRCGGGGESRHRREQLGEVIRYAQHGVAEGLDLARLVRPVGTRSCGPHVDAEPERLHSWLSPAMPAQYPVT